MEIRDCNFEVQSLQMEVIGSGMALRDGHETVLLFLKGRKTGTPLIVNITVQGAEVLRSCVTEVLRNMASRN